MKRKAEFIRCRSRTVESLSAVLSVAKLPETPSSLGYMASRMGGRCDSQCRCTRSFWSQEEPRSLQLYQRGLQTPEMTTKRRCQSADCLRQGGGRRDVRCTNTIAILPSASE
eukprot:scaffold699_cov231-Pinguiococcus_pyrenoidosus.AAC.10